MSRKECPSCAMEIDAKNQRCPICGYEFPQQKTSIKWIAVLLIVLFTYPLIRLVLRVVENLF